MLTKIKCRSRFCRNRWVPRVENPLKCPKCGFPLNTTRKARKPVKNDLQGLPAPIAEHDATANLEVGKQLP